MIVKKRFFLKKKQLLRVVSENVLKKWDPGTMPHLKWSSLRQKVTAVSCYFRITNSCIGFHNSTVKDCKKTLKKSIASRKHVENKFTS